MTPGIQAHVLSHEEYTRLTEGAEALARAMEDMIEYCEYAHARERAYRALTAYRTPSPPVTTEPQEKPCLKS